MLSASASVQIAFQLLQVCLVSGAVSLVSPAMFSPLELHLLAFLGDIPLSGVASPFLLQRARRRFLASVGAALKS